MTRALLVLLLASCALSDLDRLSRDSIAVAKQCSVRSFDPLLPDVPMEKWLLDLPGALGVEWESNDCGEQTGSGEPNPEFPICAQADLTIRDGRTVIVMIATGVYPRPVTPPIQLWGAFIRGTDGELREVRPLRALAAALRDPPAAQ